ncbi:GNAT family protein [Jannaschia sp. LMIT008]|uniref:GNAT family N-acetyltransferase n=1 Tax=Jannaschia maritima TaxID=3032585 RepID=UPI002811E802|nr:GNAT family protein [Jannaschia sp. LMIT008]
MTLGRCPRILRGYGITADDAPTIDRVAATVWVKDARKTGSWIVEWNGGPIGTARLHSVASHDARATVALGLVDGRALSREFGSKALSFVLDHASDALRLHRLCLRVLASIAPAIRCYERAGFVLEGRDGKAALTGWGRADDLIHGVLAGDRP